MRAPIRSDRLIRLFSRYGLASLFAAAVAVGACGGSPTTPASSGSLASTSFAGSWNGTTGDGSSVAFTVASDNTVTGFSFSYKFNVCSGTQTFVGLRLPIAPDATCLTGQCPAGVSSYRQFSHSATSPSGFSTELVGLFFSTTRAEGQIKLPNHGACGDIGITWQASKP